MPPTWRQRRSGHRRWPRLPRGGGWCRWSTRLPLKPYPLPISHRRPPETSRRVHLSLQPPVPTLPLHPCWRRRRSARPHRVATPSLPYRLGLPHLRHVCLSAALRWTPASLAAPRRREPARSAPSRRCVAPCMRAALAWWHRHGPACPDAGTPLRLRPSPSHGSCTSVVPQEPQHEVCSTFFLFILSFFWKPYADVIQLDVNSKHIQ